jgi:hypothetical protein
MSTKQKQVVVLLCLLALTSTNELMAQGGKVAIEAATTELKDYVDTIGDLILAIGAVVGVVGGIRVYSKWNGGDKDINKDIMAWAGSCVFLVLVSVFIKAFFIG